MRSTAELSSQDSEPISIEKATTGILESLLYMGNTVSLVYYVRRYLAIV